MTARDIAAYFDVSPPALVVETWPRDKEETFKRVGMAALVLVGYDGPISLTMFGRDGAVVARLGHNRAVWPFALSRTAARKDTVSQNLAKGAFREARARALYRLWCLTVPDRDRLAEAAVDYLAAQRETHGGLAELEPGWSDLGPDLDLDTLYGELRTIAGRLGIVVFDEQELSRFVDRVQRLAREILVSPKAPRTWDRVIDLAVARALGR